MPRRLLLGLLAAAVAASVRPLAQEKEDRTLLPTEQMRAIISEASGERAMHHVLELVPYPRVRPLAEYRGHFRESEVMARFANEYGYSSVEIESFPQPQNLWQPTEGQLWLVSPDRRKLYDIHDVAVSVAANSASGDVTADLVDLGVGSRAADYEGKDVKGRIVLGSAGVGQVYNQAVQRGAVGAIGYGSLRPDDMPDEIPSSSIAANATGFGWAVAPRVGRELAARLARGEQLALRSVIKAETFPGELEVVHATIQGDGSTGQDVAVSAHLYEGYLKQGANDDNSGCAMTLEVGRTYIQLVKEGKLPKPRRTIHFVWASEISGTDAWLNAHPVLAKRIIADLNFDMEGIRLATSRAYWLLHRTPDTFPSFLNDVAQSMMEFVAELNRERVRYRSLGYGPTLPVQSPNGSNDPFYIKVDKHYGASDHVTYMQHGIPSVIFNTWPDPWYHSSQDTPDKQDSTQYKRAVVVSTGAMTVLATAADEMGGRVAAENLGRGVERMGAAQRKGVGYIADATDTPALAQAYADARNAVRHQAAVEKAVIKSASVLFANPADGVKTLAPFDALIETRAADLQAEAKALYAVKAAQMNVPAAEPVMTAEQHEASRLVPERVGQQNSAGFGGGPSAGSGQPGVEKIPQHMRAELTLLIGQKESVLDIRDFLSGEFEPLPLADLMSYFRAQEKAGLMKITGR